MSEAKKKEMVTPERLDLDSMNLSAFIRDKLREVIPSVFGEGGQIDFELLREHLGARVHDGKERYGLGWVGKSDAIRTLQRSSQGTLIPQRDKSVDFDSTDNLIVEGDNLEVLKLLQKSYLGKIKLIYIDPPYNTGNDFIYPDDYSESLDTYLKYTHQIDSEGRKYSTNVETDGRFHSKWLSMMYPRLFLARNLLREDGIICVSIDDSEMLNLKALMNEVFGEECFLSVVVVQSNKRGQTYKEISKTHEYLLVYSKDPDVSLNELEKEADALPYKDSRGAYDLWELRNRNPKFGRHNRPNLYFPIFVAPSKTDESGYSLVSLERSAVFTEEVYPVNSEGIESCWRWSRDKLRTEELGGSCPTVVAKQKRDGGWNIYEKSRKSTTKVKSIWTETAVISEQGTTELGSLGLSKYFEHPKPVGLIKKCVQMSTSSDDIVLDFFAGSGSTAQAVLELNAEDGASRRFILVQLPEPTDYSEFPTIADITTERTRRVIKNLKAGNQTSLFQRGTDTVDLGFRSFRLSSSNLLPSASGNLDHNEFTTQLQLNVQNVKNDREQEDLLFEILIKSGFPASTKVKSLNLAGKVVFVVEEGALVVCLERSISKDVINEVTNLKPIRFVCLDSGFAGNDQLKVNAVESFKAKGITFKTV